MHPAGIMHNAQIILLIGPAKFLIWRVNNAFIQPNFGLFSCKETMNRDPLELELTEINALLVQKWSSQIFYLLVQKWIIQEYSIS